MSVLKGKDGKESSKRLAGFYLVGVGSGVLIAAAVLSMTRSGDFSTAVGCGQFMLSAGAGLLLGGLFEGIGIKAGGGDGPKV
jgi:hypothetical protein